MRDPDGIETVEDALVYLHSEAERIAMASRQQHTDEELEIAYDNPPRKEYGQRFIYMHGREVLCQILNWDEGPPPDFIVCNPLDKDYREMFLAHQAMGTWMKCELREALMLMALKKPPKIKASEVMDVMRPVMIYLSALGETANSASLRMRIQELSRKMNGEDWIEVDSTRLSVESRVCKYISDEDVSQNEREINIRHVLKNVATRILDDLGIEHNVR